MKRRVRDDKCFKRRSELTISSGLTGYLSSVLEDFTTFPLLVTFLAFFSLAFLICGVLGMVKWCWWWCFCQEILFSTEGGCCVVHWRCWTCCWNCQHYKHGALAAQASLGLTCLPPLHVLCLITLFSPEEEK